MILKSPSPGEHFNTCSLDSPPTFSWDATETFADFETQLSADWNFTVISFKVKVSAPATQITIPSDTWEEIMMIPSASAGTIYWRVIGTRADGTTETSAVRSFFVGVEPAGDLSISPVSKRTKPTLTWQTNCNTRLKVWFGSDTNFNKKASYSFEIANPSDLKTLTPGQWIRIKMLVKNKTGSTIYWYVEPWDALGRYAKTDVMSFVLTE